MKNHSPKDVFSLLENNRRKFCNTHGITNKTTVYEAISDLEKDVAHVLLQIQRALRQEYME